jgi:hypothetical protein
LDSLLEFKFDFQSSPGNTKIQTEEEPVNMQDEFRVIRSGNLMIMKRMISDCHLEVVQPLISIQAGIERNLKEIPNMTKRLSIKMNEMEENMTESNIKQKENGSTLITLSTLNLTKSNEIRKKLEDLETKKEAEKRHNDLKLSIEK